MLCQAAPAYKSTPPLTSVTAVHFNVYVTSLLSAFVGSN